MATHSTDPRASAITFTGLDPALGSVGQAISLLEKTGKDTYAINDAWFENPIEKTRQGFGTNSAAVAALLKEILGEVAGQALGIPTADPSLLGSWYPIKDPSEDGDGKPTGLYIVSYEVPSADGATVDGSTGGGSTVGESTTVLGLGVLHRFLVPDEKPDVTIDVWGLVPLLLYRGDALGTAFEQPGFPISIGLSIASASEAPLVSTHGFRFSGVKVSAGLDLFRATHPVPGTSALDLSIVALGLQLPGESQPEDRSLADLAGITGEEITNTTSALFLGALEQVVPEATEELGSMLPMLGLSSRVQGSDETLPVLAWSDLFRLASQNGNVARPFIDWFTALTAEPALFKTWISTVAGFLGSTEPVTGSGTRTDPFLVPILGSAETSGVLAFSAATSTAADGTRSLFPGLRYSGKRFDAGSFASVQVDSEVELAQFRLSDSGSVFGSPSALDFSSFLTITGQDGGALLDKNGFKIESILAGGALSLGLELVPRFELRGVESPTGDFDRINLLSPDELAEAAGEVLTEAITSGLEQLLGLTPSAAAFVDSVASLLGIQPPALEPGETWPSELAPPLSAAELPRTVANPLAALGRYWNAVASSSSGLSGPSTGALPIEAMIRATAAMLMPSDDGAPSIVVTSTGTPPSRFTVSLAVPGSRLPVALVVERTQTGDVTRLTFGLEAAPQLDLNGTEVVPALNSQLVRLDLPNPGSREPFAAAWAPTLGAALTLPGGLETPEIAGVRVRLEAPRMLADWNLEGGWNWSLSTEAPVLEIAGQPEVPLGQGLDFSNQTSWRDLIEQGGSTFSPLLVSAIGLALARGGTRPGLALNGILGLLPNVSEVPGFPGGIAWPSLPQLTVPDLTDPVPALRQRIATDFSSDASARAVLALLDWAIHSELAEARPILGEGTYDAPWRVPLSEGQPSANGSPYTLTTWFEEAQTLGVGLATTTASVFAPLEVTVDIRLAFFEVNLEDGTRVPGRAPSLEFVVTVARPGEKLVDGGSFGSLGTLQLGFSLALGTEVTDPPSFMPRVVLVDATFPDASQAGTITLEDFLDPSFSNRHREAFQGLLDAAIQVAVDKVAGNTTFENAYQILTLLGLAIERPQASDPYGIRATGWRGLLSEPRIYTRDQLLALLSDPEKRAQLFSFIEDLLGIDLPEIPVSVLELLSALGYLGKSEQGYPLDPTALVALAGDPLGDLQRRFESLVSDEAALETLASSLAASVPPSTIGQPQEFGIFTLRATGQTTLEISVDPEQAIEIGGFLAIRGGVTFDLPTRTVQASLHFEVPTVGLSVVPTLRYRLGDDAPAIDVSLVWGDSEKPAAAPVTVYPFDPDPFVDQISRVAPAYALSVIATAVLESELLERYPFVQTLFEGLGLASRNDTVRNDTVRNDTGRNDTVRNDTGRNDTGRDETGPWRMPSLVGLLDDPAGWLLSNTVLGNDGRFDLAVFGTLLGSLPPVEDDDLGVGVRPIEGGVEVFGLPYGLEARATATSSLAEFAVRSQGISIAEGYAEVRSLETVIQLDANFQPGIRGDLLLATGADAPAPFFVRTGFDDTFLLTVGAGEPESASGLALRLFPFLGWGSLAAQLLTYAPQVAQSLMRRVFTELNSTGQDPFLSALESAGGLLRIQDLIDAIVASLEAGEPEKIERDALDWLVGRVANAQLPDTVKALGAIFQTSIPEIEISDAGLIRFEPSADLPLTVLLGVDTLDGVEQLGAWVRVALPERSLLRVATRPVGVGLALPLVSAPKPIFSFGVDLTIPIDGDVGPRLSLGVASSGGVALAFDPLGGVGGGVLRNVVSRDVQGASLNDVFLNDAFLNDTASDLSRELLPEFFGGPADLEEAMRTWILDVLTHVLPRYVSVMVLNQSTVKTWLTTPIVDRPQAPTPLALLEATSLVVEADGLYRLNSFDALAELTVEGFVANFMRALLGTPIQVLSFKTSKEATTAKGEIWIEPDPQDENAFGFRLVAPDLEIPGQSRVVLQVGAENSDWIADSGSSVPGDAARGIAAYVPLSGDGPDMRPHFDRLKLALVNLGIDFGGSDAKPLVDMSRFRLGSVEPRALITLDMASGRPQVDLGGALILSDIGISVAPNNLVSGSGGNPVASNLLGSGTEAAKKPPTQAPNNPPTNPAFSLTAAYSEDLFVELKSNTGSGHDVVIPIERTFGPLHVSKLGLGWNQADKRLRMLFGGGVNLFSLDASVQELTVGIPVTTLSQLDTYSLDLQGLDVSFAGGPVQISGGFLKQTDPLNYVGAVSITASVFNIAAAGGYGVIDGAPSLFIFGALNAPLGGPPPFFVTGVALGMGFNRELTIPDIDGVYDWPLVKGVREGTFTPDTSPDEGLQALADVVSPAVGEYWLAAGLQFRTFELLSTFALLNIKFGRTIEVALLGVMSTSMPPRVEKNAALSYLELALAVVFKPEDGVISAQAQLTPNSFVLVKECRVTGGFAAFFWFKDIETPDARIPAGQFVISLGGYHPAFAAPSFFPEVPRLGLTWKVEAPVGNVSIDGGAYFALVPTAVMAGGYLKATFDAGPLSAWFQSVANFLIEWSPFFFQVDIGVQIGAQFQTSIAGVSVTLRAALGANLFLTGPKVRGQVEVNWYVISFTIPFGDGPAATTDNYLQEWTTFADEFLPPEKDGTQQVVKLRAASGQLAQAPAEGELARRGTDAADAPWQLRPVPFEIAVDTAVPISTLTVVDSETEIDGAATGIRPMNRQTPLASPTKVAVRDAQGEAVDLSARGVDLTPIQNGAPGALWSQAKLNREFAPNAEGMLVEGALVGLSLAASKYLIFGQIEAFSIERLAFEDGTFFQLPYAVTPNVPPSARYSEAEQKQALARLMGSIMAVPVVAERDAILAALDATGLDAPASPDLSVMASSAVLILVARPILARLGIYQTGSVQAGRVAASGEVQRLPEPAVDVRAPQVRAVLRRYPGRQRTSGGTGQSGHGVWLDRSRGRSGRALAVFDRCAEESRFSPPFRAGTQVLWELDSAATNRLEIDGGLPLRLSVYDRHHCLLAYRTAAPGAEVALPEKAAFLYAQGADEPLQRAEPSLVGWHESAILARIDPYHAVGDGVILRPQNELRLRRRRREFVRGQVSAEALVRGNKVRNGAEGLVPGWIQTIFEQSFESFVVAVPRTDGQASVEPPFVTATRGERPEAFSNQPLEPSATFATQEACFFVYDAPPVETSVPGEAASLTVLARPKGVGADARIVAVYATDLPSGEIAERWPTLQDEAARSRSWTAPQESRIRFNVQKVRQEEAA